MVTDLKSFQKAYSIFLGKAWTSESNMSLAKADPASALQAAGFDIPDGAQVTLHGIDGYGNMEDQFNLYQVGLKTGNFAFSLPSAPPSKGHIVDPNTMKADDTSYCCCCCPCCSCT